LKKCIIILMLVFIISLFGCSSNGRHRKLEEQIPLTNLTLEDVTNAFKKYRLQIKPQIDADYPKIYGIEPKAYEVFDGIVFIYVFNNNKELRKGLRNVHDVFISESRLKAYGIKNILIVYFPGQPKITPITLANEIDAKIKEIIKYLEQINNKK